MTGGVQAKIIRHNGSVYHEPSFISDNAIIGRGCVFDPFIHIEAGAVIGDNVKIGAFSYISGGVKIPEGATIEPGTIVKTWPVRNNITELKELPLKRVKR